ncbi:hypothetical protein BGZ98_010275 [Dissophora globulifera]|nr:hypothetical protein BGZ98_010275 [Dissophora globulifera]
MLARTPIKSLFISQRLSIPLVLSLFVLATISTLSLTSAAPSATTVPRRGHSATFIQDTVYFVGGLGTAAAADTTPVKSISALDLKQLLFSETATSLAVYNHAATSNQTLVSPTESFVKIGVSFGQTTAAASADALQWLDPSTGIVSSGGNGNAGVGMGTAGPLQGRVGHSLVQFGNNLWVFGGRTAAASASGVAAPLVAVADTPTFDLSAKAWYNRIKGLSRYGHASARAGVDKIVSCYGINSASTAAASTLDSELNDAECVYFSIATTLYAPAKLVWTNPADQIQGGRKGHTLVTGVANNNLLYLFGGTNTTGTQYFQDVYQLDTTNLPTITVTKVASGAGGAANVVPSARAQHAAVAVGTQIGFMVVHGGITSATGTTSTMASAGPFFFSMSSNAWINSTSFIMQYQDQRQVPIKQVSVAVIIACILAGVSVLGAGVAYYIWRGLRDDELERLQKESSENQADGSAPGRKGNAERKSHMVYPLGSGEEDHSLATGPFKSTTSLLQSDEPGKKANKAKNGSDSESYGVETGYQYDGARKPWTNNEPYSPGGTTLTENGSVNGYFSSSVSSSAPSRLNKNNSYGSSSQHSNRHHSTTASADARAAPGGPNGEANNGPSDAYYNPHDLYVDSEDDDSSISVSAVSESVSPWAGPMGMSMDLAPPNPRFSRGAISQAHRQLVGAINTTQLSSNGGSQGWDMGSPGGLPSGREDGDHHRRSVNSMQWVSYEPLDLTGRPESIVYDPLSQQRSLTVRNASMYSNNRGSMIQSNSIASVSNYTHGNNSHYNNTRGSMYSGSNTSDTNTDDSGSHYSGPGGKRISTALAARQQRRSMRYSQDSQSSLSRRPSNVDPTAEGAEGEWAASGSSVITPSSETETMVTKVLPIITNKITKPTLAKVVANPRGSRIVVPNSGGAVPASGGHDRNRAVIETEGIEDSGHDQVGIGLGIDLSGFATQDGSRRLSGKVGNQGRRRSSTLNPANNRSSTGRSNTSGSIATGGTMPPMPARKMTSGPLTDQVQPNVVLRMPPPNHRGGNNGDNEVRESIFELSRDMPGFLNYGDNS